MVKIYLEILHLEHKTIFLKIKICIIHYQKELKLLIKEHTCVWWQNFLATYVICVMTSPTWPLLATRSLHLWNVRGWTPEYLDALSRRSEQGSGNFGSAGQQLALQAPSITQGQCLEMACRQKPVCSVDFCHLTRWLFTVKLYLTSLTFCNPIVIFN